MINQLMQTEIENAERAESFPRPSTRKQRISQHNAVRENVMEMKWNNHFSSPALFFSTNR